MVLVVDVGMIEILIVFIVIVKLNVLVIDFEVGYMISVVVDLVLGDFVVLSDWFNGGVVGYWLVGYVCIVFLDGLIGDLVVVLGWVFIWVEVVVVEWDVVIYLFFVGCYLFSDLFD